MHLSPIESQHGWDKFLFEYSPQSLFQSWQWGEIEKKSGNKVIRYGIYSETDLVGIAQVFFVKAKRGAYLHIRQGPVLADYSEKNIRSVLDLFTVIAKADGALFIRISPMIDGTRLPSDILHSVGLVSSPIHEVDAERCWVLDISKSEGELLLGMRKTTRYEIKRGLKMDIQINKTTDIKDIAQFTSLYEETSKRHGFVSHGSIREEFEQFLRTDQTVLFLGYYEKKLVASALILFFGGQAIYHHGASNPSKAPVSHVLQWHAILEAKKRGIGIYNFYGVAPEGKPNHPWNGLTLFKKGFGGNEVRYMHAHDFPVSPYYIFPKLIETIRTKLRGHE